MPREPRPGRWRGVAIAAVVVIGIGAAIVSTGDPNRTDVAARLAPPSATHWLGQDALGRDVLARLLAGARVSFVVALGAVTLSLAVGVTLGATAALASGWTDLLIARVIDVVLAFPGLLLAIALAAVRGPGIGNVVAALALLGWTGYARLTRSEIARLRHAAFADAARALGASPVRLALRHLLPLAAPAVLVQATFGLSAAIVAEASLSFLGLGVPPPTPSWGSMLDEGRQFLLVAPHLVLVPGVALATTVLLLQLAGDRVRDRLDVRSGALSVDSADSRSSIARR